ncbi:MAG: pentapeptide repeat-containing protein [Veillonellaceae bacterium]|nr:pentapeptide repeat-containing protein [Veillonellaceae bacterium]
MRDLNQLVQTYLRAAGYHLLDQTSNLVIADKLAFAGDRDTRLVWITPPNTKIKDFVTLEHQLLRDFDEKTSIYPNARCHLVSHHRDGFSRNFRTEAKSMGITHLVPAQFFDTPFKHEESPESASAIKTLLNKDLLNRRVPQPFSILENGSTKPHSSDLLKHILDELIGTDAWSNKNPCLRIIVGAAGIGKSVLFGSLFNNLYHHFIDQKTRQRKFYRPIPLIPDYLHSSSIIRYEALIDNFMNTDVAVQMSRGSFEWMLENGFSIWLFDGLDELYAGDIDFFEQLLDILTRPDSMAQIVICARDSLLSSSENFANFVQEFSSNSHEMIKIYKLNDWDDSSRRIFTWFYFEDRYPQKDIEPPKIKQFLDKTRQSKSLKILSGLPYYCSLIIEEFNRDQTMDFDNDFTLLEHVISGIIQREVEKGLLKRDFFEKDGLDEWIETIALELYSENYKGLLKSKIEEYAQLVLRPELLGKEYADILQTLIRFPLFIQGIKPGVITYKHELLCEYLAGKYLTKQLPINPKRTALRLGNRIDFADSLIARYMATQIMKQPNLLKDIVAVLKEGAIEDKSFANLLQLALLATPVKDIIKRNNIILEGRDIRGVKFIDKELENISFRNCDLSSAIFRNSNLKNSQFEGAHLCETRFENIGTNLLAGGRFGNIQNFESIFDDNKRIDDRTIMIAWVNKKTGFVEKIKEPCAAALQLRALFLKFLHPNGSARTNELSERALLRGKKYSQAISPEDCLKASIRFGFLQAPDFHKHIKRNVGDRYSDIMCFVRDWKLSLELRQMLNSLCPNKNCQHIPENMI